MSTSYIRNVLNSFEITRKLFPAKKDEGQYAKDLFSKKLEKALKDPSDFNLDTS